MRPEGFETKAAGTGHAAPFASPVATSGRWRAATCMLCPTTWAGYDIPPSGEYLCSGCGPRVLAGKSATDVRDEAARRHGQTPSGADEIGPEDAYAQAIEDEPEWRMAPDGSLTEVPRCRDCGGRPSHAFGEAEFDDDGRCPRCQLGEALDRP